MSTLQGAILGVIASLFLGLSLVILVQHYEITKARTQYENLLKDSSVLQAENENWKSVAAQQNSKFLQLTLIQKATDAAVLKAVTEAQKKTQDNRRLAAQIATQKTDPNDCIGAQSVKDFYLKNRK